VSYSYLKDDISVILIHVQMSFTFGIKYTENWILRRCFHGSAPPKNM